MYLRILSLVALIACTEAVLYSSFWAPLFNPRILNYRVDAAFDPAAGRREREEYVKNYGVKGERLIADLGNGRGPVPQSDKRSEDVRFYYTYPEARQDNHLSNNIYNH